MLLGNHIVILLLLTDLWSWCVILARSEAFCATFSRSRNWWTPTTEVLITAPLGAILHWLDVQTSSEHYIIHIKKKTSSETMGWVDKIRNVLINDHVSKKDISNYNLDLHWWPCQLRGKRVTKSSLISHVIRL